MRAAQTWAAAALLSASTASLALATLPSIERESASMSPGGSESITRENLTLVQAQGPEILLILAVPIALSLILLSASGPGRSAAGLRWGVAGLLGGGSLVSIMSIGVLYIPTVILAFLAASSGAHKPERPNPPQAQPPDQRPRQGPGE